VSNAGVPAKARPTVQKFAARPPIPPDLMPRVTRTSRLAARTLLATAHSPHRLRALVAFPFIVLRALSRTRHKHTTQPPHFQRLARPWFPLQRQSESQLLCFHARAHSFVKTPGVPPRIRIASLTVNFLYDFPASTTVARPRICDSPASANRTASPAPERKSTPLLSCACALFCKNTGGTPQNSCRLLDCQLSLLFPGLQHGGSTTAHLRQSRLCQPNRPQPASRPVTT